MKPLIAAGMLLMLFGTATARAQGPMQVQRIDDPPRFAAYWELGGNARVSANVDVLVLPHTSIRAGGILVLLSDDPDLPWNGLVMVNHLFGDHGHYLETGVGVVAIHHFDDSRATTIGPTATIGYRLQTRQRFLRFGLTPAPPRSDGRRRGPIFAISIGRTF
jgi:hypothetical protein